MKPVFIKKLTALIFCIICPLWLVSCGKSSAENAENQIIVFNYGDYIDRDVLDQFYEETGIKVVYEEFLTPEAMYTKYKNGTVKYDLICCSEYMLDKMIKDGEAREVDFSSMKYTKNIGKNFWEFAKRFDTGNKYILPYFGGQ